MGKAAVVKNNKPVSKCEYCGASFKKLEHLQRHTRTHTLDRPYACPAAECGKTFARQDTLTRHYRLHTRDLEAPKRKETSLIMHGRRRTKSAPADASPSRPVMVVTSRQARERRATEFYLPSPAPSDTMDLPAIDADELDLPLIGERSVVAPFPKHKAPVAIELFHSYGTPESMDSPLPFTADSASFDLGDYSSTTEDTHSLLSVEDDTQMTGHTEPDYEAYFSSYNSPAEEQHPTFMSLNALHMSMGEVAVPVGDFKGQHAYGPGFSLYAESYLAP